MENGKSEPSKKKNIRSGVPASILRIGTWVVSKFMIDDFFFGQLCQILNMHLVDVPLIFSGFILVIIAGGLYLFVRVHACDDLFRYNQFVKNYFFSRSLLQLFICTILKLISCNCNICCDLDCNMKC
jgi:hypothetical protein